MFLLLLLYFASLCAAACFCASHSKSPSNHEVSYARNVVLFNARAHGLDAIDLVQTDFKNEEVLRAECQQGMEMGFTGKQVIHPKQIEIVQKVFAPSDKLLGWAKEAVEQEQKNPGVGAFVVAGQMVDAPLIKKAKQIIEKAKAFGML